MATGVGVARRIDCVGSGYLLLAVCAAVSVRVTSSFGEGADIPVRRARRLNLVPYLTGGILSSVAGALNPVGPVLILVSAAAASFGGDSGLAWMWNVLRSPNIPNSELQMHEIVRSWEWALVAVFLAILFIVGLGPGVKFH